MDADRGSQRLRRLLELNLGIVEGLDLRAVLSRVVEASCHLLEAPYGALGVLDEEGTGLAEFVHHGMDPETVARIGTFPAGKGLLGVPIEHPRPVRVDDITADCRSVGLPHGHPPLREFLGVPLRVRGQVYGNLYLARNGEGPFGEEDEELLTALAATAGVAIANARLYETARRRQEWLEGSTEVTRRLLASPDNGHFRVIAEQVQRLASAEVVTLVLPDPASRRLEVEVAVGPDADLITDGSYPLAGTLSETVLQTGVARSVDVEAGEADADAVHLAAVLPVGPVMVLPLTGSSGTRGTLVVARRAGRPRFGPAHLEMATTFANHAALALELAEARRDQQRMLLLEDRARIARDLHDHVIQQLFATGMTVQTAMAGLPEAERHRALERVLDNIDQTVRQLRTLVHQLKPPPHGRGLRSVVLDLVAELTPTLRVEPHVLFEGPVDTVADDDLVLDVAAVVREALTNVARHAEPSRVDLRLLATAERLEVTVRDDGVGIGASRRRSGLANLRQRALARSGDCTVNEPEPPRGTLVTWSVPVGAVGPTA